MFGAVDTGKSWHSQVCPRAIGGITTCHKIRHSLSLPTVTYICVRELPHFHHGPTSSFLHSQPIQTPPSGSLAKRYFGIIPLSRHSVDRSPWAFHSSSHNAVRASCFEVLSASVESRRKPVLGRALAMEWMSQIIFLEAAISIAGDLSVYVGRGYTRQCIQAGY